MFQAEQERDRKLTDRPLRDGRIANVNCEPAVDRVTLVFRILWIKYGVVCQI